MVGYATYVDIDASYATGNLFSNSANSYVAGLVGYLYQKGSIKNSYALGIVQKTDGLATTRMAGLLGYVNFKSNGDFENNYYNSELNPDIGVTTRDTTNYKLFIESTTSLTSEQFTDIKYYLDGKIEQVLADRELAAQQPIPQQPVETSPTNPVPVPPVEEPVGPVGPSVVEQTVSQVADNQIKDVKNVFAGLTGSVVNFGYQPVALEASLGDLAGSVESIGNSISQVLFSSSVGSVAADGVDFALGSDAANVGSGSGGDSGTSSSSQTTSFPAEAEPSSAGGTGASSQGDGISLGGESSDNDEEEESAI